MSYADKLLIISTLLFILFAGPFFGLVMGVLLEERGREFWREVRNVSLLVWGLCYGALAVTFVVALLAVTIAGAV